MMETLKQALSYSPTSITYCDSCGHRNESGYCELVKAHTPDNEFCKDGTPSEPAKMAAMA